MYNFQITINHYIFNYFYLFFFQLPSDLLLPNDQNIVDIIFTNTIHLLSVEELSKRVIISPTNSQTLQLNQEIISKLSSEMKIYYNDDSIISEDSSDQYNFLLNLLIIKLHLEHNLIY